MKTAKLFRFTLVSVLTAFGTTIPTSMLHDDVSLFHLLLWVVIATLMWLLQKLTDGVEDSVDRWFQRNLPSPVYDTIRRGVSTNDAEAVRSGLGTAQTHIERAARRGRRQGANSHWVFGILALLLSLGSLGCGVSFSGGQEVCFSQQCVQALFHVDDGELTTNIIADELNAEITSTTWIEARRQRAAGELRFDPLTGEWFAGGCVDVLFFQRCTDAAGDAYGGD